MKMKFIALAASLVVLAGCTVTNVTIMQSVGVESFGSMMADNQAILVDVRTADEYAEGHLADAINIDVLKADFETRVVQAIPADRQVAIYCRSGNRSKRAAEILMNKGYRVLELSTGYNGWVEANLPVTKEEVDLFSTGKGTCVYAYCIKHGSVKLHAGDKWIYVDPVGNALPPVTDYSTMPKADAILVTHEHMDHLDTLAIGVLSKEGTELVVNPRSGEILGGKGLVMANGDTLTVCGKYGLKAVAAYNSEEKQMFHPKGRDNGYILTVDDMRIYFAGDTEDIEEMSGVKDIDVAFLPCNLPYTMTPEQVAKVALQIRPKVLFPYHYGETDIQRVDSLLQNSGVEVRIRQYQ